MIWLILVFSLLLRLISLDQSLWLDEAINILAAKSYSLPEMIREYARADFHPPGYFIILWLWTKIFGYSEISSRLPSVIFGFLTVYLTYLLGKKLHSVKLGLIAALLLAINPLHLYYSQEARMYAFATFAVVLNFYFFLKLIKHESRAIIYYALSLALLISSDYLAYFVLPAQVILLLISRSTVVIKQWVLSSIPAALLLVIWSPNLFSQLGIGLGTANDLPAWREVVGSFSIKSVMLTYVKFIIGRISYPDKLVYLATFLPIGLLYAWLIFRGIWKGEKVRNILLIWLLVPLMIAVIISLFIPIYSYFRLLFLLPLFILLVSLGIILFKNRLYHIFYLSVVAVAVFCTSVYLFNPAYQREDWKGAVALVATKPKTSVVIFESNEAFSPFKYYSQDKNLGVGGLKNVPARSSADVIDLESQLQDKDEILLFEYLVDITDPKRELSKKILQLGYIQKNIYNFHGVGFVYQYVKTNNEI